MGGSAPGPRAPNLRFRAGFTLLEILIVLALGAAMAAIAIPRISVAIDQITAHGEFLKFQQQVMDLRRQSFHQGQGLEIVSSGEFIDDADADPPLAEVKLAEGWTYKLSQPINIDAAGACTPADVDLIFNGRPRLHLQGQGATCRFLR
ncbi:MAG TPA: prepilin-type N-terminal cleavage/methylation domain-containing protein [Caulobacteraceae bacterium]|nr:prepilin-type N-terminal cleavage/methylation domain-containing protein [Caulobacteraceae bacterium]